ncbi:MAG: MBL fold metallo-hydrolase [Pseudomonadales bacterium]|nr:MBL fold metallo-hydrolase [Pseudomonadales bacterium]
MSLIRKRFLLGFLLSCIISTTVLSKTEVSKADASKAGAADSHHAPEGSYQVFDLTSNIKMLQGKGGNIGVLVGEEGIVLIDDDYASMSDALTAALVPFGGVEKLSYIINTHWHGDHTGGNHVMGLEASIVAHENVRQRLMTRQEIKAFGMVSEPYPEVALPSVTFREALSLYINDEQLQLIHLPSGHTDGDSIVYFKKANVFHLGDHFFNGIFPFVDVENGGNVLMMTKNLKGILSLMNETSLIIPGHGPLATKLDLISFIDMLSGTTAEVQAMKAKGLSVTQMQEKGLSDHWDDWAKGLLNAKTWIGIIDSSL